MRKITIRKSLLCIFAITFLFAAAFLFAHNSAFVTKADTQSVSVALDKKSISLEKHESYRFTVTLSDPAASVEWLSTDETVAKVSDGTVTAVGEGYAVISAVVGETSARCQVRVYDNGLVLRIKTNVDGEDLNVLVDSAFNLVYGVSYNGKAVEAVTTVKSLDENIVSVENGSVKAKRNGSTQIVIEAEWNGLHAVNVIPVNVISDFIVDNGIVNVELYNDERAGITLYTLTPTLIEEGKTLTENEYEIINAEFDDKVIDFNEENLAIIGVGKGTTELAITYRSKQTSATAVSSVTVTVGLYTEDKSNSIRIKNVYIEDGRYNVSVNDVFADLPDDIRENLSVLSVEDVTKSNAVKLAVTDGVIDVSDFVGAGILGERLWKVESEKYSYVVKIKSWEYNPVKYLFGDYLFTDNSYSISLTEENYEYTIKFYDNKTDSIVSQGKFDLNPIDNKNGRIKVNLSDKLLGNSEIYGVYMKNSVMRLSLSFGGKYKDAYSLTDEVYANAAGVYESFSCFADIELFGDGSCVVDNENKYGMRAIGEYKFSPSSANGGKINLSFNEPVFGKTTMEGTYAKGEDGYSFGIEIDEKIRYYSQIIDDEYAEESPTYEYFAGGYASKGVDSKGEAKSWCTFYMGADGTMFFDIYYASEVSSIGTYTLKGDRLSGTIVIDIGKAYVGNTRFEGTYEYNEKTNKYVFVISVYGSGYDSLTFTQN